MADPIDTGKKTVTGRTIWRDPETGEDYSERSTTFEIDGKYYTMPTVDENGNQYSDDVIREYVKENGPIDFITGEELPEFRYREDAIEYAISRSDTRKQKEEPMLEEQMKMFNEGGLKDEGGEIDPKSGNDVPIGSTKKEVRDDIPAMLSEGEFVFPADVVRYIGLENLMRLRQDAKMGLKKMEAMGQMGNSEEATIPDDLPFDMTDLIIVTDKPEDKSKEMSQGGIINAQQGTYIRGETGISGTTPSAFDQNQNFVSPSSTPASSIAPPSIEAPAGGFRPLFVDQASSDNNIGSVDTGTTGVSGTGTTGVSGTGTTGVSGTGVSGTGVSGTGTGTGTITDEKFFETVEDVYTTVEYINPETGERRTFTFYQGQPLIAIPEGFIPLKDYETPETNETPTTDLESTSVGTTMVRKDDKSKTKQRLEDKVRNQGTLQLKNLEKNINKEGGKQAVIDAYIENEKLKSLLTAGTGFVPALGTARLAAGYQGKQLENLMKENNIEIPELEEGFFERVTGAVSDIFEGAIKQPEQPEIYQPIFEPQDSPFSTVPNATNMLSSNEAKAYDNAVKSNNANAAEHYEIINNRLNKMSDLMAAGGDPALGTAMGLSKYDIEQAQIQFEKGTGAKLGDSVNEAEAAAEKAAAEKAAAEKAAAEKAAADKAAADKAADKRKAAAKERIKQLQDKLKKEGPKGTSVSATQPKNTSGSGTAFVKGGLAKRKK